MAYSKVKIPYPVGVWLSQSTPAPKGYCTNLINFIPDTKGLLLRKGSLILDKYRNYKYTAGFETDKSVMSFTDRGITRYDALNGTIEDIITDDSLPSPSNHIETNARLIFFFPNETPRELFYDTMLNQWVLEPLNFSVAEGDSGLLFTDFTNAVRYKEHVWYYKEGFNTLYYTKALAYKGELTKYDVSYTFNSQGTLIFANVAGYSAGAGVQSHLVIAFDSGDIIVYDGNNPESSTSWSALTQVSLGVRCFNQSLVVGTTLYCLTEQGMVNLSMAIAANDITPAKSISDPIKDGMIDFSKLKLSKFNNFILLTVNNESYDYIYNTEVKGYTIISGMVISSIATVNGKLYFANEQGVFYQGFVAPYDQEVVEPSKRIQNVEINGTYVSSFEDYGSNVNKIARFITADLYMDGGEYSIYANVQTNYATAKYSASKLPQQINRAVKWGDFSTWNTVKELLWTGVTLNAYNVIKFGRSGMGRSMAIRFDITATEVARLVLGNLTLEFDKTKF